jgi:hypothetical protein
VLLGAFLDPLVHIAEDFFVAGCAFGEVHRRHDPCSGGLTQPAA